MANERVGLEGRDLSRMAARVGGAEAAPIRAEGALGADAALALGAAEPEVGACGERRIEVIHQVRAERGRHKPLTQLVLQGRKRLATILRPTATVRYEATGHELTGLAVGVVRWWRRHEGEGRVEEHIRGTEKNALCWDRGEYCG